jgi:hypothetical protein
MEEAEHTEGAILQHIRTAEERRAAEGAMREMHRLFTAYAAGLARDQLSSR